MGGVNVEAFVSSGGVGGGDVAIDDGIGGRVVGVQASSAVIFPRVEVSKF